MPKRTWQDATKDILAALDLLDEFESMGVKVTGAAAANGFMACFSRGRPDDRNPSATVNVHTGRYKDHGLHGESLSFFEFAAKYGGHADWRAARAHYASKAGIEGPEEKERLRPIDQLDFRPWRETKAKLWAKKKPPITIEAIQANGGQLARWKNYPLMALPVYGVAGTDESPRAWVCWNLSGDLLPIKGGRVKVKNYGQVAGGLMGFWALERLEHGEPPELVWKVEGPSDLLALWGAIPPELRDRHLVVCTGGGSEENPVAEVLHAFAGVPVYVLHDADTAGENGGRKWAAAIAGVTETRQVRLPYEVAEKHGKDLRDWLNEGHAYAELLEIAAATPPTEAGAEGLGGGEAGADAKNAPILEQREPLANERLGGGDDKIPLRMTELMAEVKERTGNWPRRCGGKLFIHNAKEFDWLRQQGDMFGWLQSQLGTIEWREKTGCVTKDEFFREYLRTATSYESVEFLPHEPLLPDVYYACETPEPGDGAAMTELLSMFAVDNDIDRQLILAMFATTIWGGLPGSRPMFMITSNDGRGVGKSKMTDILAAFCGGAVELSANGDIDTLRSRLLSPKAAKKRLARLDNVKSFRFSCADIESLITSSTISGKEMYVGEGERQNNLTWLLTLNGASLSEDMAQRVVTIKIKRPTRRRDWEKQILSFIASNRQAIIADLIGFLRGPAAEIPLRSRWAAWEGEIVARLDDWEAVQDAIAARSGEANVESREIEELEESIRENLEKYGYHPDHERIFISSTTMTAWFCEAMGEKKNKNTVGQIVGQFITEQKTQNLRQHRLNRGRGYTWEGAAADEYTPLKTDLEQKIATGGY